MIYWDYLKYVIEHKKNVFIETWSMGLKLHAITHDLSKFRPSEFFPYARYFYGKYGVKYKEEYNNPLARDEVAADFENAWKKHYIRNMHHWDHWTINWEDWTDLLEPHEMPTKYIKQMIADWNGMARKFGDTSQSYYLNHYKEIKLNDNSRIELERMLGLNHFEVNSDLAWKTLEEIIDSCIASKETLNKLWYYGFLGNIESKYGVDLIEVLGKERI
jgi:hypothetical protein